MNIQEVISFPEYGFLTENPHLADRILFLAFGGSYAYGTNVPDSDIDIRGCTLNSKADLLGIRPPFEQFQDSRTDTVVYSFQKLISLLVGCNPNTIELLGCKPEHYTMTAPSGRLLIDSRRLFLSRQAIPAFSGYASQQLRRLQNAISRKAVVQSKQEEHLLHSIQRAMQSFHERYQAFPDGSIRLYTAPSDKEDWDTEIFMDISLIHYPLRDYKGIWAEMNGIEKDFGKLNQRNKKKDNVHLNKHAMHLIRLHLMCLDILEKEEIHTYREAERDLLLSIRNGAYQKEDGSFRPEYFEMVDAFEDRLAYAAENTSLPECPDLDKIEELAMSINEKAVIQNAGNP